MNEIETDHVYDFTLRAVKTALQARQGSCIGTEVHTHSQRQ
jgi:hypothetical protein